MSEGMGSLMQEMQWRRSALAAVIIRVCVAAETSPRGAILSIRRKVPRACAARLPFQNWVIQLTVP